MRRRPLRDVSASVRTRLLNRSREKGEDFQFLLQRYAAERFLHRLGESDHRRRLVLKGAMLLALWGESTYRPTRDLDFTGYGDSRQGSVDSVIRAICSAPVVDDGVVFDADTMSVERFHEHVEYSGVRVHFWSRVGSARIRMHIDIGFGDAIQPSPIDAHYPTLLEGSPRPWIRAYPPEAVVAEKLHAMVLLGEQNSRYKDFYDIYSIAKYVSFTAETLTRSISTTFDRRHTAISADLPRSLTPPFYAEPDRADQWRAYLIRSSLPGAPDDFGTVGDVIQAFLVGPWRGLAQGSTMTGAWSAGGPWKYDAASPRPMKEQG